MKSYFKYFILPYAILSGIVAFLKVLIKYFFKRTAR